MGRIEKKSGKVGVRIAVLTAALILLLCSCDPMALKNYITARTFGTIYVSDTTGSDSNPGTMAEPMQSIDAAIDYLKLNSVWGRVNVAEGTYNYDYSAGDFIQIVEGISLYGGYSLDFGTRDVDVHETIIVDNSTTSVGDETTPNRAIDVPTGITSATFIDGFSIHGGGGQFSAGIFCHDSSPTVTNNIIYGGTGSVRSYGMYSYDADTIVINNREINGGTSSGASLAVWNYSGSQAHIEGNYIHGGSGPGTAGIVSQSGTTPTIIANTIHGGVATAQSNGIQDNGSSAKIWNNTIFGGESGGSSIGIACFWACNAKIYNNTIDSGSASSFSIGFFLSDGEHAPYATPTPIIRNNIVFSSTSGYGIYEIDNDSLGGNPNAIDYNDFWDKDTVTTLYYRFVSDTPAVYDTDTLINGLDWAEGNISVDPSFLSINGADGFINKVLDNDWHLTVSIDNYSVRYGAKDLTTIFNTDKDGKKRTGDGASRWSMGAYEY